MWEDLVSTALLGTERRPMPPVPEHLQGLVQGELLTAAAVVGLHDLAGQEPRPPAEPVEPCPPDERPLCRPGAAVLLRRFLDGDHPQLLPEWLDLCRGRVPEELLPALLDRTKADASLRRKVTGPRAAWLAARNPEWADLDEDWETGTRAARAAALGSLRRDDPAKAREQLQAVWAQEPPAERAAFLECLETNLGPDDEAFLETALDDRRKEVRRAAAALLARLEGSAYSRRMWERARPCLAWQGWLLGKKLVVSPPEACDAAMARDGVDPKPPQGVGEKAWWLQQLLALTPLRRWQEELRAEPAALLDAAAKTDWAAPIRDGWAAACQDADWALALLRKMQMPGLVLQLPPADRERVVGELPQRDHLRLCRHAWSAAFTRKVLPQLVAAEPDWQDAQVLGEVALWLHPSVLPEVLSRAAGYPERVLGLLEARHQMLKELAP